MSRFIPFILWAGSAFTDAPVAPEDVAGRDFWPESR